MSWKGDVTGRDSQEFGHFHHSLHQSCLSDPCGGCHGSGSGGEGGLLSGPGGGQFGHFPIKCTSTM